MAEGESWDRWKLVWQHAFFAGALGLTVLGAVTGGSHGVAAIALRIGLAVALAAWYAYWFAHRRDTSPEHLGYLLGASVLWAVMAALDPALLPVGVAALIPYCLRRPVWTAGAVVAAGAAWLGLRLLGGDGLGSEEVLACGLGMLFGVAATGYVATLDHQGRKRQRLLEELAAAQAGLAAAERRSGMLAERARLARDVHDTLTQGFASVAMLLDAALADLPPGAPAARNVGQAMRTARDNLADSRRLVRALRPVLLDGARLPEATRRLTDRLAEETGITANTVVTGEVAALDPGVETELLRLLQEALANVRRHATATHVTVTISYLDGIVAVDVADDGAGFTPSMPGGGVGLASMRERVETLGGTLSVESAPGEGTTLAASVPLPAGR